MNKDMLEIWEVFKKLNEDDNLVFEAVWINEEGVIIEKDDIFQDYYLFTVKNPFSINYVAPLVRHIGVTKEGRGFMKENVVETIDTVSLSRHIRWIESNVFDRKEFLHNDGKVYLINKKDNFNHD